ncbi:MAG: MFS transporter [Burkholderiales bacterium]|nr:MFS transporter [Burkholderiales bacterium]
MQTKVNNATNKKLIIATTIGSIFEIFDFIAFVFLTPILAEVFFPQGLNNKAVWFTYLTIAISYLLRPVGGIILGHLGDKYGRKSVFTISILLMSLPSLVIGLLPTYAQIGYFATALLIIMRILQGFSVGGEVPGSITYIAEKFKSANYFFACAWLTFGANFAVATGSQGIKLLTTYTSPEFMHSIGWRLPFLFGSLLTIIGFYIRRSISESEAYQEIQKQKQINKIPLVELFKNYRYPIISGILLSIIVSLTTSIFHVFLPTLFVTYYHFELSQTAGISAVGAITMACASLLFAYLVKFINPITILRVSLLGLVGIFTAIALEIINLGQIDKLYLWVIIISFVLAGVNGLFFAILADLFPTTIRYSGIAVCYNFAYILGAGITPLWTSSIMEITQSYHLIIMVCLSIATISLLNTFNIKKLTNYAG